MAEIPTQPGKPENPHRSGTGCVFLRSPPARGFVAVLALLACLTGCYAGMDVAIPPQNVPGAMPPEKPLTAILTLPGGKGHFPLLSCCTAATVCKSRNMPGPRG